jgi:AcrR family transcriptional regulator
MPRIRASSIDEHKELTRQSILSEAKSLIEESGSAEISLGDLTAAAGIGRTTFYEYFADRDDVIASIVEEELPAVVQKLIEDASSPLNKERLVQLVDATVRFVVENPVLGLILHTEVPRLGPTAQQRIRAAHSGLSGEMADIYYAGVREGSLRELDAELAGRLIQDTIMSAAKTIIASPAPAVRAEEVVRDLREFLLSGLENSPAK